MREDLPKRDADPSYEDRQDRRRFPRDRCCERDRRYFRTASVTEGLFLGAHLLGASLKPEGEDDEGGGGFGFTVGYGITRLVAVFLNIDAANLDIHNPDPDIDGGYTLGQGDLGVRFNFGTPARRAIPYVQAAFTGTCSVCRARRY
jgi:hypothetical protein